MNFFKKIKNAAILKIIKVRIQRKLLISFFDRAILQKNFLIILQTTFTPHFAQLGQFTAVLGTSNVFSGSQTPVFNLLSM